MPRIHPSVSRALTLAILMTSAFADTVTLKSGEHLEGKITKETDKEITMSVQVSAGITDDRVVPRADIEKIMKVAPDVEAYEALANVQLGANSFSAAQYDPAISALQAFVEQFPNSIRASEVQATLKAFQDEKKRVEDGEVKINNEWLSKVEAEKEKVQINGRLAFNYMKSQSAAGDYVGALNTFTALEKTYPGAEVMPEAIDLAVQLMTALRTSVERAIPAQKIYKAERDKGMAAAGPAQRAEIAAAIKKEDDAGDAAATVAEAAGKWAPFIQNNEKCLTTLQTHIAREVTRLAGLPVDKMKQSLQLTATAKQSLASGDVEAADTTLKEATQLWAANEKDITAQKGAAKAAATPTPPPATPQPATPRPAPSTPRPAAEQQATPVPGQATADVETDDEKPFIMTIPGAMCVVGGLALLLGGGNIYLKKKKKKAEEAGEA